jgi:heme/copper-type cytochrome/quinol oxidase subunit 4
MMAAANRFGRKARNFWTISVIGWDTLLIFNASKILGRKRMNTRKYTTFPRESIIFFPCSSLLTSLDLAIVLCNPAFLESLTMMPFTTVATIQASSNNNKAIMIFGIASINELIAD